MSQKILILGKGYIAQRVSLETSWPICSKRITSYKDLEEELSKSKADIVINCIGYVGTSNVDDCETHVEDVLFSNTIIPMWLAELAYRKKFKLVHISSGCIYHFDYDEGHPIDEAQEPDYYKLFYSRSKIYSEAILGPLSTKANILCLRIRIPLDIYPHQRNLLTKLIKYRKIIDIPNSITYLPDFIKALKALIAADAKGIYNLTSEGALRYPDLMKIYKTFRPEFEYETIKMKDLNLDRTNLLLSVQKLNKTYKIRSIKDILSECVTEYVKNEA